MSHDNYITKAEIILASKKIQVFGPITFGSYNFSQKIQNFIQVLRLKTLEIITFFKKFKNPIFENKNLKSYSTPI